MTKGSVHNKQQLSWLISWEIFFWTLLVVGTELINSKESELQYQWKYPNLLWISFIIVPIYWYYFTKKKSIVNAINHLPKELQLSTFPGVKLTTSIWSLFFLRNVLVFLILSAAQPISGKEKVNSTTSSGELVICLDVSNSMNTKDIDPQLSRLEIAKGAMNELLNNLSGERIGITVFAGNAFVQLPITSDYTSAKVYINEIETNMLSNQGTNIAAALATSLNQFSPDQSGKTLLLVTDGEDHALGTDSVVNALQQNEINLCIVGIGSPTGGPVPIDPNRPELGYKKDGNGQLITSKPNKKLADQLAKQTDGLAVMVNEPYPSLDELLTEINQKNSRKKGTLQLEVQRNNYQLPLSLAFFNWLGWMWLNYSRLKRRKK